MNFKHLTIEKDHSVVTITFNRPDKLNALNVKLMHEIIAAVEAFREDVDTRVVVFTGAGKCFSAGMDLTDTEYAKHFQEDSTLMKLRFLKLGPRMVKTIYDMDQITIAAVNGVATGGGACIAAACDFRVGANDCLIGYPEVGLGMNLSWVALPMCINLIGPSRAKQMIILAKKENAATLLNWGFLDEMVPAEDLLASAGRMAETYASKPPIAAQMVKRSVNAITTALDQAIMHMDSDQFLLSSKTEDFKEGITAFLEKREPQFKGN